MAAVDEKRIAFIICSNNPVETEECIYYINRLDIPEGFEADLFVMNNEISMASGYNQAMQASDSKYKIYLHQDVFLIYPKMIEEMLAIFKKDPEIGLMGLVGTPKMRADAFAIASWDMGILHGQGTPYKSMYPKELKSYYHAEAVDGLVMATQIDIPFREDLFDAWDFYDISQCYEMKRKNKKVVIPYMEKCWYYHDNHCSMLGNYDKYRKIFLKEYQMYFPTTYDDSLKNHQDRSFQYDQLKVKMKKLVEQQIDDGNIEQVCEMFLHMENCGHLSLLEYETAAQIRLVEMNYKATKRLWQDNCGRTENMERLRHLKFLLKRVEFHAYSKDDIETIKKQFSEYAVMIASEKFCKHSEKVIGIIA